MLNYDQIVLRMNMILGVDVSHVEVPHHPPLDVKDDGKFFRFRGNTLTNMEVRQTNVIMRTGDDMRDAQNEFRDRCDVLTEMREIYSC